MKQVLRQLLIPGMLALTLLLVPCQVLAAGNNDQTAQSTDLAKGKDSSGTDDTVGGSQPGADDTATVQATLGAAGSDIETVPADDVPIQQAPSSKNSNDAMMALLEFVVLWSVIYMVIKLVRKKLEKDRPFK